MGLLSGYWGAELGFSFYPPLPLRILETGSCCATQSGYTPALCLYKSFLVIPLQPLGLGLVVSTLEDKVGAWKDWKDFQDDANGGVATPA